MTYHDRLDELATDSERRLTGLYRRLDDGELTVDEFVVAAVAVLLAVNARATGFADVALAADLTARTGAVVPPLGLPPPAGEAARLDKAFRTLLDELDPGPITEREARLIRLARDEPIRTAQTARGEGIKRSRHTTGWTRGLNPGACPACTDWAGPVLPKHARMARHTGCSCVQLPATRTTTK